MSDANRLNAELNRLYTQHSALQTRLDVLLIAQHGVRSIEALEAKFNGVVDEAHKLKTSMEELEEKIEGITAQLEELDGNSNEDE